jgi:hypothetical protein
VKKEKASKRKNPKFLLFVTVLIALTSTLTFYGSYTLFNKKESVYKPVIKYTSGNEEQITLFDSNFQKKEIISRGKKVSTYNEQIKDDKNNTYTKIKYGGNILYINDINLTKEKQGIVKEEKLYVRTPTTLYKSMDTGEIAGLAKKGDELDILDYDAVNSDGKVNVYKVKAGEQEAYIYQKYISLNKEASLANYDPANYYDVHNNRGNRFGGGHAGNLDYYPVEKPIFENNIMPPKVYALYLNSGANILNNVDAYIEYALSTNINAFVVDIKDDVAGYKSKVLEIESPTNYNNANNSFENYKTAITKIKNAGFYVIGRITVFKDRSYCLDNPNAAIMNTQTNEPYLHNNTYWPSPYQRSVWEFNVNLAKEAVKEMGFNEIQFDYVRFPDRTGESERNGTMDFRNDYGEEKAQAIQGFTRYATDELHKLNVYISIDVFGESAYTYVTAYGQYWPAISNIVDVISGMPYPDHFNKYEFDFKVPVWTVPYELLNHWGSKYVVKRQAEIPTPAIIRTWVQVYDVSRYKHVGGYPYGVSQIDAQIRGLYDAGLNGGYMTWLSNSNLERYKSQKEVYDKEY